MIKIIEVALAGKFGTETVTELREVVTATPNPEMATEILLGVYVKPELPKCVVSNKGLEKTLVNADYWNRSVTYSYEEEVRKHLYVSKDIDTSLITLDNYKDYEKKYDDDVKSHYISTGEFKLKQSSCSFDEWLSQEIKGV
jgi:hypothetical protein